MLLFIIIIIPWLKQAPIGVFICLYIFISIYYKFIFILSKTAWLKMIYKMTHQTYDFILKKCQCLVGNDQYKQLTSHFVWKVTPENVTNSSLLRSVVISDKIKQTKGQKQICVFNHGSASSTHISNPSQGNQGRLHRGSSCLFDFLCIRHASHMTR